MCFHNTALDLGRLTCSAYCFRSSSSWALILDNISDSVNSDKDATDQFAKFEFQRKSKVGSKVEDRESLRGISQRWEGVRTGETRINHDAEAGPHRAKETLTQYLDQAMPSSDNSCGRRNSFENETISSSKRSRSMLWRN